MRKLSATMTGRTFHKAIIIVKTFDRCKFQYATPQFKQTNNNLSSHSNLGLHAERTCAKPSGFGASGSYNWLPSSAADWLSGSAPRSLALPSMAWRAHSGNVTRTCDKRTGLANRLRGDTKKPLCETAATEPSDDINDDGRLQRVVRLIGCCPALLGNNSGSF